MAEATQATAPLATIDWSLKLAALLYTPPDAAIHEPDVLPDRRKRLFDRLKPITGNLLGTHGAVLDRLDRRAWAADRPWLDGIEVDFAAQPVVGHPFSPDRRRSLWGPATPIDRDRIADQVDGLIAELVETHWQAGSARTAALAVWRRLPELLIGRAKALPLANPRDWLVLPADARLSDSVWTHSGLLAALAAAGDRPAFLIFTIAGAQDFIGQARRGQDLWAGSYLVSWLSWAALRAIAESLGPDAVLLPSLTEQPLVDRWLADQGVADLPIKGEAAGRARSVANLPNIFTALVPWERAAEIGEGLRRAVHAERDRIFGRVRESMTADLHTHFGPFPETLWSDQWKAQTEEFLEAGIFWSAALWRDRAEESIARLRQRERRDGAGIAGSWQPPSVEPQAAEDVETVITEAAGGDLDRLPGAGFAVDVKAAAEAMSARKNTRDFPGRPAAFNAGACGLCGQRPALLRTDWAKSLGAGDPIVALRLFWDRQMIRAVRPGRLRGSERLCAVCLVKRLALDAYLRDAADLTFGAADDPADPETGPAQVVSSGADRASASGPLLTFPSTAAIATAPFKEAVLARRELAAPLRGFLDALHAVFPRRHFSVDHAYMPPRLDTYQPVDGGIDDLRLIDRFKRIDGDWLYAETYRPDTLRQDDRFAGVLDDRSGPRIDAARKALADLIAAAQRLGIPRPARYYAILVADGDRSGEWIGGARNPAYGHALHPAAREKILEGVGGNEDVLGWRRPAGPASLAALGAALGAFSLDRARRLIEGDYLGKLLYSGGDDIVALVPLWNQAPRTRGEPRHVLDLADRLARAFRSSEDPGLGGHLTKDNRPAASLSQAIVVVHQNEPLATSIQDAHTLLEERAKGRLDRNALALSIVKRSGSGLEAGWNWAADAAKPPEETQIGRVGALMTFLRADPPDRPDDEGIPRADRAARRDLSPRLAHVLSQLADSIGPWFDQEESRFMTLAQIEIGRRTRRQAAPAAANRVTDLVFTLARDLAADRAARVKVAPWLQDDLPSPWQSLTATLAAAQFLVREG